MDVLKVGAVSLPALVSRCAMAEARAHRLVYTLQLTHQLVVRAHQPSRAQNAPAEAEAAFHAARSCVSRKRFGEAESFARAARDAEPSNPEYLALHAWLRMHAGALSTPAEAAQIIGALDRAVMKARESVTIRLYRAHVLRRLGRAEEAFKDFRFVARREPNNLDAVREVRLHLMRARNDKKASGVFAKLFLR